MGNTREKKTIADEVCRVHRSGGYAVLSNCFVRSVRIGCDSIGLLAKIMDLPSKWNFTIKGLAAICKDGETAIRSQLAELEEWGYAKKVLQKPNENPTGQFRYVYDFYEYSEMDDSIPKYDIEMETFTADNATLNRVKKDSNFTMVSGKLLRTTEIRNKLIGFMLKVLSLPNSWRFSMPGLQAICKEGKTAIHNAVNKLIDMGYLVRTKLLSNESMNNHFEYVYSFFDVPVSIMFSFLPLRQRISREHFRSMSERDRANPRSAVNSPVSRCSSRLRSSGANLANKNRGRNRGKITVDKYKEVKENHHQGNSLSDICLCWKSDRFCIPYSRRQWFSGKAPAIYE